jgi:hypothetical protein
VAEQHERRRVGIASFDARHEAGATRRRFVHLQVEPGVTEVLLQQVDAARLVP